MKRLIIFTMLIGAIIFLACAGQDEAAEKQREAYVKEIETKLLKLEDYILALRERADNVLTEKKAEFEAQIDSLARKQETAEAKLAELKEVSAQNWENVKSEMETLMAELDSLSQATRDW